MLEATVERGGPRDASVIRSAAGAPLDWVNILFLISTPLIALAGTGWYVARHGLSWLELANAAVMYLFAGMSVTAGYHRFWAHRSYRCSRPLQLFYLMFGAAAVENSVLNWASDHRYHHRYVDRDEDPYNVRRGGFWAHMGWIFYKDTRAAHERFKNVPDLLKDPLVMWQQRWYLFLVVAVGFGLPTLVGALGGRPVGGLLWGGFLRLVVCQHMTFLINSAAHLWGSRPYSEDNTARDNWLLGPLTFGEGYHNFHHKFSADYRNGHRWYQFDATKWWLWAMRLCRQAWSLKKTPERLILKARLEVQTLRVEKRLEAAGAPARMWLKVQWRLQYGRRRLEEAYARYQGAVLEYRRQKRLWSAEMRRQWSAQLDAYEAELDEARRRWRELIVAMNRLATPRAAQGLLTFTAVVDVLKYRLW